MTDATQENYAILQGPAGKWNVKKQTANQCWTLWNAASYRGWHVVPCCLRKLRPNAETSGKIFTSIGKELRINISKTLQGRDKLISVLIVGGCKVWA